MRTLTVPALTGGQTGSAGLPAELVWQTWPVALIDHFVWPENDYRPRAWARLGHDDAALYLRLAVEEADPRITWHQHMDPVYLDSCLEFFVMPKPGQSDLFFNFEFNAAGALLAGVGRSRHGRTALTGQELASLVIEAGRLAEPAPAWQITCRIPRSLLESHCGALDWQPGLAMAGNFYKCGDQTPQPHYGCWNLVASVVPDFHQPAYFGRLILT